MSSQLYQQTAIGRGLAASLTSLVAEGEMPPELAQAAMDAYDKAVVDALNAIGKDSNTAGHLSATLDTYNFCNDLWCFNVTDAELKIDGGDGDDGEGDGHHNGGGRSVRLDKLKIVCEKA